MMKLFTWLYYSLPFSMQKYINDIFSFIRKSLIGSLIKVLTIKNVLKNVPFCYLKYFPTDSLKKWQIKIWKESSIWKWFKCLAPWKIEIWDYTYLAGSNLLTPSEKNSIKIWRYCSIADGVDMIAWYYHDYNKLSMSPSIFSDYELWASIEIWNDVRIWRNAIILKWVRIWDGCVIWAWSVVTKSFPPYTIIWWIPAKILKKRFSDDEIKKIQNSKWREKEPEEIKNLDLF